MVKQDRTTGQEQIQEKQKQENEQKERERKQFNRRVNYFIMRYMWQVIHGRKRSDEDTIYHAFDTSRERYTRIIDTGNVRFGKTELEDLQQITGLSKDIFTGETRFVCPYVQKRGNEQIRVEITEEDWRAWAAERESGRERKQQKEICKALQRVSTTNMENRDFYRLCFYLKNMEPAPSRTSPDTLRDIVTVINRLSFPLLDGCQVAQLQGLQKLLKEKNVLISSMIVYKNARDKERKK